MQFENKQGITEINMYQNIQAYCPLGDEYYTNEVSMHMTGMKVIPDYCDLDKFLRGLAGSKMIIEDVVATIFDKLDKDCQPEHLVVTSLVHDAIHLDVTVSKEK